MAIPTLKLFRRTLFFIDIIINKAGTGSTTGIGVSGLEIQSPYERHDVSVSATRSPRSLNVNIDEATLVKVYVYDDPAIDQMDLIPCYRDAFGMSPWQDEHKDGAQDMAEIWLHRAMLEHPWRVSDPDQADLFFVPLYPVVSFKLLRWKWYECGLSHDERLKKAMDYLQTKSKHFKRFGGADHVVACAWWNCHRALNPWVRMVLRRAVIGTNELLVKWTSWGCGGRSVTVPYTPSSVITTEKNLGGLDLKKRDIPFFFVGSARNRIERRNLEVRMLIYFDIGKTPALYG